MKAYIPTYCIDGFNMIDGSCECDNKLKKLSQVLHAT